jgi:4-hydroxyphenylacetate 3-monooxygenase
LSTVIGYRPSSPPPHALRALRRRGCGTIFAAVRDLAGGALIMLPSCVLDFANPELAAIINKTQRSATMQSEQKVKFLKAAWDAIGSEFGSRHTQYEMFSVPAHASSPAGHSFRTFDWDHATGLIERLMASYGLQGTLDQIRH